MKYKIYCGDKQYKIPNIKLNGYGDLIKAPWEEDVAIKLLDGDTLYITKTLWEGESPTLLFSLESGYCCSVFYDDTVNNDVISQSGDSGWICDWNTLGGFDAIIRIYKFGDYESVYDIEGDIGSLIDSEVICRKHGKLVAVLKYLDGPDGEYWRVIDPTASLIGQTIALPKMNDEIFISNMARVMGNELGYYYVFESGAESIGFLKDTFSNTYLYQSQAGWFAPYRGPQEDDELVIYQCGTGWYDWQEYTGNSFTEFNHTDPAVFEWFNSNLGKPLILRYNGTTWDLIQEGDRNDF